MVIITISGDPGSGKTTLARQLASHLHIPFYSMGDVRGEFAVSKGMTLSELNAEAEIDPSSDTMVDEFQKELPDRHDSFVIDSRLGFFFIPQSFKIYVHVDPSEGARRVAKLNRADEPMESEEEAYALLTERIASDRRRYLKLYKVDIADMSVYDLVIDSTRTPIEEKLRQALAALHKHGISASEKSI